MQENSTKFHALLNTNKKAIANFTQLKSKTANATIDNQLSFEKHINNICGKINTKICALSQIAPFIDSKQKTILRNAF